MEAKCAAGKFNTPEEIGLTSPHKPFTVTSYFGNISDS